jgi:hypothetical protein
MSRVVDANRPAATAMESIKSWTGLRQILGVELPVTEILKRMAQYDRAEGLVTLSRIAADLVNAGEGIAGPAARAWTHDLLAQARSSSNPLEQRVAEGVSRLPKDSAIVHGRVLFTLQALFLACGAKKGGRRPHDAEVAFLFLALNDHIPQWMEESPQLALYERKLAFMAAESIFNHTFDDPMRFIVRSIDIMEGDIDRAPLSAEDWKKIQFEALGCSFREYAERFLVPIFFLSKSWGYEKIPGLDPAFWIETPCGELYRKWFRDASASLEDSGWVQDGRCPGGLPRISGAFFRTPFVEIDPPVGRRLLGVSPWHLKDHVNFGTWAKFNAATKSVFNTKSNERFTSTFGLLFERWCAMIAEDARREPTFRGRIILPERGEEDVEDVVVVDGDRVVLFSAKSTLIREGNLKAAKSLADIVAWFRDFFFRSREDGEKSGHRSGAALLLDAAISRVRAGKFEGRGVPAAGLIIPVLISYDYIGEGLGLYQWIDTECEKRGILGARAGVRPLTVVAPTTYEALMASAAQRSSLADLLIEKTDPDERLRSTEWFLAQKVPDGRDYRSPRMEKRFRELADAAQGRLEEIFGPVPVR